MAMKTCLDVEYRCARTGDYGAVLELMDRGFGRDEKSSLRHEFPTALDVSNLEHLYLGSWRGQVACAAAALRRRGWDREH